MDKTIVTLRADIEKLKADLAKAKQLATEANDSEIVIRARMARERIIREILEVRRQLRDLASESPTITPRVDAASARREIERLQRSATIRPTLAPSAPRTFSDLRASRPRIAPQTVAAIAPISSVASTGANGEAPTIRPRVDATAAAKAIERINSSLELSPVIAPRVNATEARREIDRLRKDATIQPRVLSTLRASRPRPVITPPAVPQPQPAASPAPPLFRSPRSSIAQVQLKVRNPTDAELSATRRHITRQLTIPPLRLRVDASTTRLALATLRRDIRHIVGNRQTIHFQADVSQVMARLARVHAAKRAISSGSISIPPTPTPPGSGNGNGGGSLPGPMGFFARRSMIGAAAFGAFPGVGSVAGGVATAAGAGIAAGAAAGGKVAFDGISGLAEMERYRSTLGIVLKDQEKANKLLGELEKLDLELPVDLTLLAKSATQLAAAGFGTKTLKDDLTAIMDAASISTDGVHEGTSRVVRALTQMRSNGRLLLEEINQIAETGIPIRTVIEQQFGMNAATLAEKSQAGEIDIDTIIQGIITGFDVQFGGSLQEQAKTLTGQMDTLADKYRAFAREVAEPLFDPLKDSLELLIEAIDSDSFDQLTEALKAVSEATGGFITKLNIMAGIAATGAGGIVDTAGNAAGAVSDVASTAGAVIADDVASTTSKAISGFASLVGRFQGLLGSDEEPTAARSLASGIAGIIGDTPLGTVAGLASDTAGAVGSVADTVTGAAGSVMDTVIETSKNKPKKPKPPEPTKVIDSVSNALTTAATDQVSVIKSLFGGVGAEFAGQAKQFAEMQGIDVENIPKNVMNAAQSIRRGDAEREREELVTQDDSARFDKEIKALPAKIKAFAATITDPEERDIFERSKFKVTQERDENGRLVPRVQLEEIAKAMSRGEVQKSGFDGLNSLVQSNIDRSQELEVQKQQAATLKKIEAFTKATADASKKPREAIVAAD